MNIDYLANLVQSSDVSTFRTLATLFLRSVGYPRGFYSDGPYDGGVDFFVHHDKAAGVQTAFQLSIESKWRIKLESDLKKAKSNYPEIKAFVFISSRRIPVHSIRKLNTTLIQKYGIAATHYDNQAIATEFIDKNLVGKLYEALGIAPPPTPPKALTTPKVEAASALLLFGTEADDFRSEMTENLVLAELRKAETASESKLSSNVMAAHSLAEAQRTDVLRAIRHAVQSGRIVAKDGSLQLSQATKDKQDGLRSLASGEFAALKKTVETFLKGLKSAGGHIPVDEILEDFLALAMGLWRRFAPHPSSQQASDVDETFHRISSVLNSHLGAAESRRVLSGLADLVAQSDFAKRLAAAELYYSLVRTSSTQLVAALGGQKGLLVLFDTPVIIPLLCGLLFDKVEDHAAYSARLLIDLLGQHKFTALAPNKYIEEAAAHLIDCCRNYQSLLVAGEDLSFSSNAFASHYSQIRKLKGTNALTFDDYISTFGSPPGSRYKDLSDAFFYPTIEKISARIASLLARYSIEYLDLDDRRFDGINRRISEVLSTSNISRAPVLVAHDARVVGYLEGPSVESGFAKILCTWDSVQLRLNPAWDSYCVMNPASVTDILTLLRSDTYRKPMAQLVDFVWMQTESAVKLSSQVWDEIVAIEKGNLADGALLAKARAFRASYINNHKDDTDFDAGAVSSLWLKWKRSEQAST
jgi:hypothetical protein